METKPSFYAIITANVRYSKELSANAKLLYGEITALCASDGKCWASDSYFQNLYGVSKTTIQNWLKNLEENSFISREVIYKEGSKQILKRYIRIVGEATQEKLTTPIQENLRDNNTSFNNTFNNTINNLSDSDESNLSDTKLNLFEKVWETFPATRRKNKKDCQQKFFKAVKTQDDYQKLFNDVVALVNSFKNAPSKLKFMPLTSTYFNQEQWNDGASYPMQTEYDSVTPKNKVESVPEWIDKEFKSKPMSKEKSDAIEKRIKDLRERKARNQNNER